MTTTASTGRPVTDRAAGHYITHPHTVTGTAAQLANILNNHRNAGTLIAVGKPRPTTDGRFEVVIRLREFRPTRPTIRVTSVGEHVRTSIRRPSRKRTKIIAVTGTAVGLITVAVYLIGQLVELIATHLAAVLVALALAAILATAARRRSATRRHCPGC
jgi:hypothetical protein